jgi:hypothetical protein
LKSLKRLVHNRLIGFFVVLASVFSTDGGMNREAAQTAKKNVHHRGTETTEVSLRKQDKPTDLSVYQFCARHRF